MVMLLISVMVACVHGYTLDKNHRLVLCWDQISFYDKDTLEFVKSYNMTSFPYIDNVSTS
jgi:hypothetical protein